MTMNKVKITVVESRCRGEYCKKGDTFIVEDLCPPICHEFWNVIYPYIYTRGYTVMQTLRVGGLRPSRYTRGHPVIQALRAGGLRPSMYALQNGAELDFGDIRLKQFDAKCPMAGECAFTENF